MFNIKGMVSKIPLQCQFVKKLLFYNYYDSDCCYYKQFIMLNCGQ